MNDISPLERHPYNNDERFRIPLRTKTLIVGTAPPPRFSLSRLSNHRGPMKDFDADFYYGSKDNILWGFLTKAFAEPDFAIPGSEAAKVEDTENMMQKYLAQHDIWMRDVLETYRRKPGRARSGSEIKRETVSNGCSQPTKHAPNSAAPIQLPPKIQNHCDEPLVCPSWWFFCP